MGPEEAISLVQNDEEPHRRGIDKAMGTLRVQPDAVEEMWRRLACTFQRRGTYDVKVAPDGFLMAL